MALSKQKAAGRHAMPPSRRREIVEEVRVVRDEAARRYTEADLLVAALRDHVRDLRAERDQLRAKLASLCQAARLDAAEWFWRGTKGPRD